MGLKQCSKVEKFLMTSKFSVCDIVVKSRLLLRHKKVCLQRGVVGLTKIQYTWPTWIKAKKLCQCYEIKQTNLSPQKVAHDSLHFINRPCSAIITASRPSWVKGRRGFDHRPGHTNYLQNSRGNGITSHFKRRVTTEGLVSESME